MTSIKIRLGVGVLAASWIAPVAALRADAVDVIPKPVTCQSEPGTFHVQGTPTVATDGSAAALDAVAWLASQIGGASVKAATDNPDVLFTTAGADASLGDEGYTLDVSPTGVVVRAVKPAGLFYGAVTLTQLLPPSELNAQTANRNSFVVPRVHIVDHPRFAWRGLMFDVARHFTAKQDVLRLLDEMAMHKLNVLHWHLTDDQGWRIEIKQYPKLTSIGAWRDKAGFDLDPKLSTTYGPDGRYGGFYTQDDVKEVVAAAAKLHILLVPEIEMPGHSSAARRAYPEYFVPAPPPKPGQVIGDAGVFNGIYDPANEQTFVFLQNVLTEVMALFPSPYIHVGGDEVPKGPWEGNGVDVAFMKQRHLAGGEQLQSYFVTRVEKFIAAKGRRMVGWDEILEGGLAPGAVVMSWRGTQGGLEAANADHDVVMTPSPFVYLDYVQGRGTEPHETGSLLTVQKTYSYEPVPDKLPADKSHHVLGVQGNLWTEYVPNFPWAEYMIWPRAAAIAETGWTPAANKNWQDFARRLKVDEKRDDALGIDYRPLQDDELTKAVRLVDGKIVIDPLPHSTVHYAVDGTYPTAESPAYTGSIAIPDGFVQLAARYFTPGIEATPATAATFLDGRQVRITSTMPRDSNKLKTSFFTPLWGGGADDTITVTFDGGPVTLRSIAVETGTDLSPQSQLKRGVLEISTDGNVFTQAAPFTNGSARAELPAEPIAAFRIRILAMQMPHPNIRSVELK